MSAKKLILCLVTLLIVSCSNAGRVRVEVTDTACDWVVPIYLTENDIKVMDQQTKRDILTHNKSVQANCPKL
ncbi:hypothetical protein [Entomohabitans teleogrylli]|uniref:hypothetical protein n=1 Tax=Entomohabitans teleogrylli TaxID=1384589 RepID=UPI002011E70D|nr:hypothetical protein [Entomohabitans teleogrylli]